MTLLIILLLIILGVILLLLEFAVIPGSTIAGVSGIIVLGYTVYLAFDHYGTWAGILTVVFLITLIPVLFLKFLKSKTGKMMQLDSTISGKVDVLEREHFTLGDRGKAISRLAPMGKVEINNRIVEGKSTGEFIDDGAIIEIVEIQNNKLIVKQIQL
jgi:membrane-bound ClpP family serine protease